MKDNHLLRSALFYAQELQFPVFPLKKKEKDPLTPHGFLDASLEEKQIREWWHNDPQANIGIPTGIKFWVLDIDPRNGGEEELQLLIARHGALPDTIQQISGGGGRHYLFSLPPNGNVIRCGHLIRPEVDEKVPGIDIKGKGGYIVVAPSLHPSGRAYCWDGLVKITEQRLLPAPDWLIEELARTKNGRPPVRVPDRIQKGQQHETLFRLGCSMRAKGFAETEIFAALWEANLQRCQEPGPEANIRKLAHSICEQFDAGEMVPRETDPGNSNIPPHSEPPEWPPEPPDGNARNNGNGQPKIRSIPQVPLMRDCQAGTITYMEQDVVAEGCVTAFTGSAGCGKSTLACAIARRAHATGRPVLILDRENPKVVVEDRFTRLGMTDDETFHVWGGWTGEQAPQPGGALVQQWVIQSDPKPLVLVDSLSAFHGGDQNDAGETRKFLDQLRQLADLGATPLLMHHDGKAETAKDYRGSSDFAPAIDIGFHVVNFSEDGKLDKLVLRCFKSRFGFAGNLVYRYAGGHVVRQAADEVEAPTETVTEQLTALLRLNPGVTSSRFGELANDRNLGRNRAREFLSKGVLSGKIRRERGGWHRNEKRHFLVVEEGPHAG